MRPLSFQIPKAAPQSIHSQTDKGTKFYDRLHAHPEMQITWILQGHGTFICGSQLQNYEPDDIFIIGPDIPHLFKSDDSSSRSESFSLFIESEYLQSMFFSQGDYHKGEKLVSDSLCGIYLSHSRFSGVRDCLHKVRGVEGIGKIEAFAGFLRAVVEKADYPLLSEHSFTPFKKDQDGIRMNHLLKWMTDHFREDITLEQATDKANMTKTAFCRYFKERTGYTYTEYLNSLRINHACKLLSNTEQPISDIGFMAGFNNISLFNRNFKKLKGISPRAYRKIIRD